MAGHEARTLQRCAHQKHLPGQDALIAMMTALRKVPFPAQGFPGP